MMNLINEPGRRHPRASGPGTSTSSSSTRRTARSTRSTARSSTGSTRMLVGLTATPKDEVDHNTYRLFHLEDGVPTDAYGLDEAVARRLPRAAARRRRSAPSSCARASATTTSPRTRRTSGTRSTGARTASPDEVDAEELNRFLFNEDTVDKVLAHADDRRATRSPAATGSARRSSSPRTRTTPSSSSSASTSHYPEYGGHFARVITHGDAYAQSLIDDFSISRQGAAHRDLASTCSTPASTCPRSSTSSSSRWCGRRRSSGR